VTDSRTAVEGVRRRRECLSCGQRFSTLERIQMAELLVVKKDGRREPFSREKVLAGIRKACEKRPIPASVMEVLAEEVESVAAAQGRAEVPSTFIGDLVMERLRTLDHIAYIRFASVYRDFADVDDIRAEIERLERARTAAEKVLPGQLPLLPEEPANGVRGGLRMVGKGDKR
jgi:transcriptional repressor NrdR